jgi:hypothetical protein
LTPGGKENLIFSGQGNIGGGVDLYSTLLSLQTDINQYSNKF